jgi:hypothetical protein
VSTGSGGEADLAANGLRPRELDVPKAPRPSGGRRVLKGGELSDSGFEEQDDGRFRPEHLDPDDEFTVTAKAKSCTPKSATFTLVEGATKKLEVLLGRE